MWLRDYARAFHHESDNLKMLEDMAGQHGVVVPSAVIGKFAVGNFRRTCGKFWYGWQVRNDQCPACESTVLVRSLFSDVEKVKKEALPIPLPSKQSLDWAKELTGKNVVGVFARGRKTYGRNLPPDFYIRLVKNLQARGKTVVWLGEKQSSQPCPVKGVLDFSRMPESRDLEKTLAIIRNCEFTVQFWTASTRLSGMMGVPFLIFESPEQIYPSGLQPAQEGKRLELSSFGPYKIVIAHYQSALDDQQGALDLVERAIDEMVEGDYSEIAGMVSKESMAALHKEYYDMISMSAEEYYNKREDVSSK